MKKCVFIILLLIAYKCCLCQRFLSYDDSLSRTYDYFNGETFPEMQLEDTSGNLVNTLSFSGKTVYVDFWFTTCPPCVKEIPHTKTLQQYFSADTNLVFLNICIEDIERKSAWKDMVRDKELPGVQLFYARNRPQQTNLLRKYNIAFPTYLLVNTEMKIIGYNAPRPSETGWIQWAIIRSQQRKRLSESYVEMINNSKAYQDFVSKLKDHPVQLFKLK